MNGMLDAQSDNPCDETDRDADDRGVHHQSADLPEQVRATRPVAAVTGCDNKSPPADEEHDDEADRVEEPSRHDVKGTDAPACRRGRGRWVPRSPANSGIAP